MGLHHFQDMRPRHFHLMIQEINNSVTAKIQRIIYDCIHCSFNYVGIQKIISLYFSMVYRKKCPFLIIHFFKVTQKGIKRLYKNWLNKKFITMAHKKTPRIKYLQASGVMSTF